MNLRPIVLALPAMFLSVSCATPIDYSMPPSPSRCGDAKCDFGAVEASTASEASTVADSVADSTSVADTATAEEVPSKIDGGVDTGRAEPLPDSTSGDPCGDCMKSKCGSEVSACVSDMTCKGFLDCSSSCVDEPCIDKCFTSFPTTKFDPLITCLETKCGALCK